MDGSRRGEAAFGREDDLHQVLVAVVLHQRHNGTDRAERDPDILDGATGLLAEVGEEPPLHRPCEVCVREEPPGLPDPVHGGRELPACPLSAGIRRGGDIKGDYDIASYRLLELECLPVAHLNLTVDRELKRSGVGHDDAVEVEDTVEPLSECSPAELRAPPEDVGVCDQGLDPHLLHLARGHQGQVRVDDREERRRPDRLIVHLEFADPSGDIFVYDLKSDCHSD